MEGGAESGFRRVEEAKYKPRLLKVSGSKKHVTISEVRILQFFFFTLEICLKKIVAGLLLVQSKSYLSRLWIHSLLMFQFYLILHLKILQCICCTLNYQLAIIKINSINET